jgi:hypothetical protein
MLAELSALAALCLILGFAFGYMFGISYRRRRRRRRHALDLGVTLVRAHSEAEPELVRREAEPTAHRHERAS